jgi:hypothetical protein
LRQLLKGWQTLCRVSGQARGIDGACRGAHQNLERKRGGRDDCALTEDRPQRTKDADLVCRSRTTTHENQGRGWPWWAKQAGVQNGF